MANRKKQTEVVNDGHMPRKKGPCKKSSDGLHVPVVTRRDFYQVLDADAQMTWPRLSEGMHYQEWVHCSACGKRAYVTARTRTINVGAVLDAGSRRTVENQLDKINAMHPA